MLKTFLIAHEGVSPIVSQTSLTILMAALGISLLGFVYGRVKGRELILHRWTMTLSMILILVPVFAVMLPATFRSYTDPDFDIASPLSLITIIHGLMGLPTLVLGLIFLFNDLPKNTKAWMRRTTFFMVSSFVLGILLFLVMLELITFPAMIM